MGDCEYTKLYLYREHNTLPHTTPNPHVHPTPNPHVPHLPILVHVFVSQILRVNEDVFYAWTLRLEQETPRSVD